VKRDQVSLEQTIQQGRMVTHTQTKRREEGNAVYSLGDGSAVAGRVGLPGCLRCLYASKESS